MHQLGLLCSSAVLLLTLCCCPSLSDKINDATLISELTSQQLTLLCLSLTPKRLLVLLGSGSQDRQLVVYELAPDAFTVTPQPIISLRGGPTAVSSKWPKLWSAVKGKTIVGAVTIVDSLSVEYLLLIIRGSSTSRSAVLFNLDSKSLVTGFASGLPLLSSGDALISSLSAGVFYQRKVPGKSGNDKSGSAVYQAYSFPGGRLVGGNSSARAGSGYSLCHTPGSSNFTRADSCPVDHLAPWTVWCGFTNATHFFLVGPEVVVFAKDTGKNVVHVDTLKLTDFLTTNSLKRSAELDSSHGRHITVVGISLLVLIGIVLIGLGVWYFGAGKGRRSSHRFRQGSHQSGANRSASVRTKGSGQHNRSGQSLKGSHQTVVKGSHSHAVVAGSMAPKGQGANQTAVRAVKQGASTCRQRRNSAGKYHSRRASTCRKATPCGAHRRTPTEMKGAKNRRHQRSPKLSKRTVATTKEKSTKSVKNLKAVETLPTLIIIPAVTSEVAIHQPFKEPKD